MQVRVVRQNDAVLFKGINDEGNQVSIEGSPQIGGTNSAMRPMQLVLVALASCSSMDLVEIIKKQRMKLDGLEIIVDGQRSEDQVPSVFTAIKMHFILTGELDTQKVERALELAVRKYCSVEAMLKATVDITYTYEIHTTA